MNTNHHTLDSLLSSYIVTIKNFTDSIILSKKDTLIDTQKDSLRVFSPEVSDEIKPMIDDQREALIQLFTDYDTSIVELKDEEYKELDEYKEVIVLGEVSNTTLV